jgi:putative cell wall-binding protein
MRRVKFVFTSLLLIGATIAIARAASDNEYLVTVLVSNQAADHAVH